MSLKIAVQMDPIERINIRGDSTFALLLEAQSRGHAICLLHARPAGACRTARSSRRSAADRARQGGRSLHARRGEARTDLATFDVVLLRQDPPFDLAYITTTHLLERIHPKTLVVNDPRSVRNAPEKMFVMRILRPDAADADHARPRRDQGVPRRARRHRDEAALRPRRRSGVPRSRRRTSISARSTICSPPPSAKPGWCRNSCRP